MHEWALAEAVIDAVHQIIREEGLKEVNEVHIQVGELQQLDHEIMEFALAQLRSPMMKHTKFCINTVNAELECRVCRNQWSFGIDSLESETAEAIHFVPEIAHTYLRCPKCNSPDFKILTGRGIWLTSVKGVK